MAGAKRSCPEMLSQMPRESYNILPRKGYNARAPETLKKRLLLVLGTREKWNARGGEG